MRGNVRSFKAMATLTLVGALASGCASIPEPGEEASLQSAQSDYVDGWNLTPAMTVRKGRQQMEIINPAQLPEEIYNTPINLGLQQQLTIKSLSYFLREVGIPTMIVGDGLGEMRVYLPDYSGSVGALLNTLASATDINFNWTGSVLVIEETSDYLLRVPQQEYVVDTLKETLESLGALEITASKEAGIIRYQASKRVQDSVQVYLDKMTHNTAVVNLQLAVINVRLDDTERAGFDWSALAVQAGKFELNPDVEAPDATGVLGALTGNGFAFEAAAENLTLQAALNLLSTYGRSQTAQNVTLKTLSGVPVRIRSGTNTPYVSEISTVSLGDSATGGANTDVLKTGFEAEVSPLFDAEEGSITLDLELTLETLLGFKELKAGNQIGSFEQPETQDQEFTSRVRLEAGETAMVGGLIFESVTDNRSSLKGLEKLPFGSKNVSVTKNAMFILMRPTITMYGPNEPQSEL